MILPALVRHWSESLRGDFEERAAIIEYDATAPAPSPSAWPRNKFVHANPRPARRRAWRQMRPLSAFNRGMVNR